MEKVIRFTIKALLSVYVLLLTSCFDDFALIEKRNYIDETNKAWMVHDSLLKPFHMIDNFGIANSFSKPYVSESFEQGSSGISYITIQKTFTEHYYMSTSSNYGTSFSSSITADRLNYHGDAFSVNFGDINVSCSLKDFQVFTFNYYRNNVEWTQADENDKTKIYVKVAYVDTITIRNQAYKGVLRLSIKDNPNVLNDNDVTEIYYGKRVGLLKYQLKNGISIERQKNQ